MNNETNTSRRGRRWVTLFIAAALASVPVAAWAGHQFTDVTNSNIFHADIDWLADNGVTIGCNPPANTRFCPDGTVTREQMAAFLHRLETNGVFLPGDSMMVPIARFRIAIDGTVDDAEFRSPITGTPTASWTGTSWRVDLPGENFTLNDQQAICVGVGSTARIVTVGSTGGDLLVHGFTKDGSPTQVAAMCTLYGDA